MPNPFASDFEDQNLQTLYRKMKKTAKARFNAAKRLSRHQTFLLWSTSVFSMGLIVLPLIKAFSIPITTSDGVYSFIQVALALVVLVFSLILAGHSFSSRAEEMHRCGLELNSLCHEILPDCKADNNRDAYVTCLNKYNNILNAYENHSDIDFDLVKTELPIEYKLSKSDVGWIYLRLWGHYGIYAFLLIVIIASFVFLFVPWR